MIEFRGVTFSYDNSRVILNNVDLRIGFTERVAVLGKSGEGKTTILRLVMGLVRPDSGRIVIDGDDITDRREEEMREPRMKFSIVFQEGALFDSLSVKENVAFCLREYTDSSEEDIDATVRRLLSQVGVIGAENLMPEELSGGMHRRVAIARSLAAFNPRMFLYDEPTSGLDPVNASKICGLINDLSGEGRGLIVVTHKVSDALKIADRFLFLRDGAIVYDGGRKGLLESPDDEIRHFIHEGMEAAEMHSESGKR